MMQEQFLTEEIIWKFREYLELEEKTEITIEKYIRDVSAFMKFLSRGTSDKEEIASVSKDGAIRYKKYLLERGYAVRSINSMIASINKLFVFLECLECRIKSIKVQRQVYCSKEKELTKEEYIRLLNTAQRTGKQRLNLVLQTICSTGIRVSELQFITVEAVKQGEAIVSCKGKTRRVFLVSELRKKLLRYVKEKKLQSGSIFVTRNGKPMSRTNIWREMKNICDEAKVNPKKVFPHNLRHLFARSFYSLEKDIAKLADILGHGSIETTRIYIVTTGEEHRQRMEMMRLVV